ncbi:MAG TPA: carbohydrate porin [Acetobacteraceae bacterium]|jgi:porin
MKRRTFVPAWALSLLAMPLLCGHARAQASAPAPSQADAATPAPTGFWDRASLTGDWGGARPWLIDRGITLGAVYTDEVLGNVAGGIKQGTIYEGKLELDLDLDLAKLVGWSDGKIHVSAFQIHGEGLTTGYVGSLATISNIETPPVTVLDDLYLEQGLLGDRLNIRVGQFAADEEFFVSTVAATFINATFGWPTLGTLDLPGGGPTYPLATPAIRVRYRPSPGFSVQGALFSGNPLGNNGNPGGVTFPVDGIFAIAEAAYTVTPDQKTPGLPAAYKIGAWYDSVRFADLHVDNAGLSLANPLSSGDPRQHQGDFAVYGSIDQMLWRRPDTMNGGLASFVRVAVAPQQDRNPIVFYADAGATFTGVLPGHDDDVLGLAVSYANVSSALSSLSRDNILYTGNQQPIRAAETVLELTYQLPVTPWLILQPDVQYVFHPGGNAPDPNNPTIAIRNATIAGLRATITF